MRKGALDDGLHPSPPARAGGMTRTIPFGVGPPGLPWMAAAHVLRPTLSEAGSGCEFLTEKLVPRFIWRPDGLMRE